MSESSVRLRLGVQADDTGAKALGESVKAAKQLNEEIGKTNKALKAQQDEYKKVSEAADRAVKSYELSQRTQQRLASMGRDASGAPVRSVHEQAAERVRSIIEGNQLSAEVQRQLRAQGLSPNGAPRQGIFRQAGQAVAGQFGMGGMFSGPMGIGMGVGVGMAAFTAAMEGVVKLVQKATQRAQIGANQYMSEVRKASAMSNQWDPWGIVPELKKQTEAQYYTPIAQQNEIKYGVMTAENLRGNELSREWQSDRNTLLGLKSNAAATEAIRYGAMPGTDRSTAQGRLEFGWAQQRLSADDEIVRAQRRVTSARAQDKEMGRDYADVEKQYQIAKKNQDFASRKVELYEDEQKRILKQFSDGQGGYNWNWGAEIAMQKNRARMDTALHEKDQANLDVNDKLVRLANARNEAKERGLRLAEAEAGLGRAQINQMQAEIQILGQREQITRGSAVRLGSMNPGQIMVGKNAIDYAQKYGFGALTPAMKQSIQSIAPMWYEEQAAKYGEKNGDFKWFRERNITDYTQGGTKELQGRQDDLIKKVREKMQTVDEELAKGLVAPWKEALGRFSQDIVKAIDAIREDMKTKLQQQRTGG